MFSSNLYKKGLTTLELPTKCNLLEKVFFEYPNAPFDYSVLSYNPNLTAKMLRARPKKGWNFRLLSNNETYHTEQRELVPEIPWEMDHIARFPRVSWEDLRNPTITGKDDIKYTRFSRNPNITWEIVRDNPKCDWNHYFLSENLSIPIQVIMENLGFGWDPTFVSARNDVTWEIVQNNPNFPWKWKILSRYCVTWENIRDNPEKPWDLEYVSANKNITPEIIQENPTFPWNYHGLSKNPNITEKFIRNNIGREWNWAYLSENRNITIDFVKQFLYKKWGWFSLSLNPTIATGKNIRNNPYLPWDWSCLWKSPKLSYKFIRKDRPDYAYQNPNITYRDIAPNTTNIHYFSCNYLLRNSGALQNLIRNKRKLRSYASVFFN